MSYPDKRNILHIGPPEHPGKTEITPAMVDAVRQRIKDAGGILILSALRSRPRVIVSCWKLREKRGVSNMKSRFHQRSGFQQTVKQLKVLKIAYQVAHVRPLCQARRS
jgi:uncharacterized protein (DUF362 family)